MLFEFLSQGNQVMNDGIAGFAWYWQAWIWIIAIVNLVAVFFIKKRPAQLVLLTMVANGIIMNLLAAHFGFEKILGLGHFLWIFLLIYLYRRYEKISVKTLYGKWVRAFLVIISLTVAIDIIDVIRYFIGI
jgi:hypothetical protein